MPRNASGTYTLPTGNPVVTGTLITSTWANATMPDIGTELTASLDRNGRGSMLAAFKATDGLVGTPGIVFSNEPTTGFWRAAAGQVGVSILATNVGYFTAAGFTGAVTGHASLDVAKTGDTMTGALNIGLTTPGAATFLSSNTGAATTFIAGNFSNVIDADFLIKVSGVGAGTKFTSIGPSVAIPLLFNITNVEAARLDVAGNFSLGGFAPSPTSLTGYHSLEVGAVGSGILAGPSDCLMTSAIYYNTAAGAWIHANASAGGYFDIGTAGFAWASTVAGVAGVAAVLTERMRLSGSTGNLGIGTGSGVAPPGRLHVTTSGSPSGAGWDAATFVVSQGNTSVSAGLGIGYDTAGGKNVVWSLQPGVVWKPLEISCSGLTVNAAAGALAFSITSAGVIQDAAGLELGYKGMPRNTTWGQNGQVSAVTAGFTLNTSPTGAGFAASIYNDSAAAITLTQGAGVTLRLAGTALTGSRTLAARGFCTLWVNAVNEYILSGAGLS